MGIVNVTPDSFSDGGLYLDRDAAVAHGVALASAGASILDVGGESTRPGAPPVDAREELRRVLPVVRTLTASVDVPVSIDTTKAEVALAAISAGASIVNDVSGGTHDERMRNLVADAGVGYVVMHMRGTPRSMQQEAHYDDVIHDVARELRARVDAAVDAGVRADGLLADPGIGFAKTAEQNVELLGALPDIAVAAGAPLVVGTSRKSFLGRFVDAAEVEHRDIATLATTVWCFVKGAAVVRVHAVDLATRAAELLDVMEHADQTGMAA